MVRFRGDKGKAKAQGNQSSPNDDGSLSRDNSPSRDTKKPESRRPPNTAFRQQRLKSCIPVLTPVRTVIIWTVLAAVSIGAGVWALIESLKVSDLSLDYTNCATDAGKGEFVAMPRDNIQAHFKNTSTIDPFVASWRVDKETVTFDTVQSSEPFCTIQFNIPQDLAPTVILSVYLENFFQNHRKYVQSYDASQLRGDAVSNSSLSGGNCKPLAVDSTTGKPIYPCGLIANSMFNDTIGIPTLVNVPGSNQANETYNMTTNGIAWSQLEDLYGTTKYNLAAGEAVPPPLWHKKFPNGYTSNATFDVTTDFHFQNWMQTAAAPNFWKLWLRNDNETMKAGTYQIKIGLQFNTTEYKGKKAIVISTLSQLGTRNVSLGIIWLVVAGFSIIMDVIFIWAMLFRPRKMGDHTHLSWNRVDATR